MWLTVLQYCVPIIVALVGIIPTIIENRKKTEQSINALRIELKNDTEGTNKKVDDLKKEFTTHKEDGEEYKATLIASDVQTDLAVIRIEAENLQPAVLGVSADMNVGDDVYAIGNPLGSLGGTVTEGILSAKDREITIEGQNMTLLQTSAAINPGNSGGGLFNAKGELIGVVNAKSSGSDIEGLGFAIPIDIAKTVVNDLVENGKVSGRLVLGISYYEINSLTDAMKYGVNALGLLVGEVTPNSNASRAGIQVNDVIVEVDGKQVETTDDLRSSLTKKEPKRIPFLLIQKEKRTLGTTE